MMAFPMPEVIIPAVMMPIWSGKPKILDGPVRKVPTTEMKHPITINEALCFESEIAMRSKVARTTTPVKWKKKTPI